MQPTETSPDDRSAAGTVSTIRACRADDVAAMLAIINSAATVYRGQIPADCWHEPYMSAAELRSANEDGIAFAGCEIDGSLNGVMGYQQVSNVDLIRHAYVLPASQGRGVGSALIAHLRAQTSRQILVGTWTAATWAVRFYERHDFERVSESVGALLLRTYWSIPQRQLETSLVLASPRLSGEDATKLVALSHQGFR